MLHHGGKSREASARYRIPLSDWLDLSTGINPDGYPVAALSAAAWQRLPEDNDGLEAAAASYYQCDQLLPVAGSQAALQLLPELVSTLLDEQPAERRGSHRAAVLLPRVGYKEHEAAWRRQGFTIAHYDDLPTPAQVSAAAACVVINPNNPTGHLARAEELRAIHRQLQQRGGWLVVDEAFGDALPAGQFDSMLPHIGTPGLVVLRGIGKFFGLAGVRVGFLFAEAKLRRLAAERLGPWTLPGPSREIARLALSDTVWQSATARQLAASSSRLSRLLRHYLGADAGSWLFRTVKHPEAPRHYEGLCRQGILVRLTDEQDALRFGLPPDREVNWQRLERALKRLVARPVIGYASIDKSEALQ